MSKNYDFMDQIIDRQTVKIANVCYDAIKTYSKDNPSNFISFNEVVKLVEAKYENQSLSLGSLVPNYSNFGYEVQIQYFLIFSILKAHLKFHDSPQTIDSLLSHV